MEFGSPQFWVAALEIIVINILLSGDNAVVIALACRNLPKAQRKLGIFWGVVGAVVLRIILTFFAVQLLLLPYVQLVGAALLVWIGIKLVARGRRRRPRDRGERPADLGDQDGDHRRPRDEPRQRDRRRGRGQGQPAAARVRARHQHPARRRRRPAHHEADRAASLAGDRRRRTSRIHRRRDRGGRHRGQAVDR